jgi:hypothetical protein
MFATREIGGKDRALWLKLAKFSVSIESKRVLFTPLTLEVRIFLPATSKHARQHCSGMD